jgi:acyl-CoA thioester hydrolase
MKEFTWRARVYWEDTDGGGVVYYANYLRFMERARTEWLRSLGHSQGELVAEHGFVFAVVEAHVNYRRPARLDDELLITCLPVPEGRVSIRFNQVVRNAANNLVIADGEVRVACVDATTFRPRSLPDFVKLNT